MKMAETIKNDVEQELRWEPSVCATKIGVSVNGGVVELDGHVGSLYEKWAAERAALRVVNVTSVASEIVVDLPFESERTDQDIAAAATNHFTWNFQVPNKIKIEDALKRDAAIEAKNITVETNGNAVTLTGRVHSWTERDDAEQAAFAAPGVGSVSNLLTVSY